ncbi:hypothetical protein SteCoe_32302 [Stentor coeruleus]|nr:hypothetical protein SteCoe_32302 [Stentor coeruleus]
MSQVDEVIERIKSHYSEVKGIIICNYSGVSVKSTMTAQETTKYSRLISALTERARSMIREFDCTNDLIFLRVRTKKNEVMIAPDNDYLLIVVQHLTS